MRTIADLKIMQALPLQVKVAMTKQRIRDWVAEYGVDGVYVSFSGGKDSTVLLHIVRSMYPSVEAVFVNTGLEYPEIQRFVKQFENVTILHPKIRFDEVIRKYGYPVISKDVAECVYQAKKALEGNKDPYEVLEYLESPSYFPYAYRLQKLLGIAKDKNGNKSLFNKEKWKPLLALDFDISSYCCNVMKKKPAHEYCRKTGKKPITAQMAAESKLREQQWIKNGCNGFDMKSPISNPMSFWTEQDVFEYIKQNDLPIAPVYGEVVYENNEQIGIEDFGETGTGRRLCTTGCKRTGCIFCAFGAHLEKGEDRRFVRLKKTHPLQYEYCINGGGYDPDGIWKPTKDGLGMGHIFDELNEIYGEGFIEYK